MALDPELLAVLVCPVCRGALAVVGGDGESSVPEGLACAHCAVVYPVRDEIPVMLAEEAVPAREWEKGAREADPATSAGRAV